MTLVNFGQNVRFQPTVVATPRSKNDVVECFARYRGKEIRAVGRLHSWSDVAATSGVVLDLRHLNRITVHHADNGTAEADIEAGCTVGQTLDYLRSHGGFTLPTFGMIRGQTVAGAIATATHGAGRASLSHYVRAMTVAAFTPDGAEPRVYEWKSGPALAAARCALGCSGIVLSVRMAIEREQLFEEHTRWSDRLEDLLEDESRYPRQQMYLVPWAWRWFAQQRRELPGTAGVPAPWSAYPYRALRFVGVDLVMNGAARTLSRQLRWPAAVRWHFRHVFPRLVRSGARVVDTPARLLMMRHDLFAHVETELFVPAQDVTRAAALVEWLLRTCAGESIPLPAALPAGAFDGGEMTALEQLAGRYVHDHPITARKVLADDALISMTSSESRTAWYAFSLVTYRRDIAPFLEMARILSGVMARAYGARPHWGKVCPLPADEIARLYPRLPQFRQQCAAVDPHGVFVNDFARHTLGFSHSERSDA